MSVIHQYFPLLRKHLHAEHSAVLLNAALCMLRPTAKLEFKSWN
ncbi:MAG: hypothetical protein OFPII_41440 [Osedax symbiont Rs1]|nr:MAG: hypothetical protein OFPII_41440 [Osedax symbiont Rs1]